MSEKFKLDQIARWIGLDADRKVKQNKVSSFENVPSPQNGKVALALGGGAALGWAHIGFLQILREQKLMPDMVVGTSIGAIAGAAFSGNRLDELEGFARSLTPRKMLTWMDFSLSRSGLINGEKLVRELNDHFGDMRMEDLPIPFYSVATDLLSGEEIWFNCGPLVPAIRASYAIPGVFVPVKIGNRWLVDGGLTNPLPISAARHFGADKVIAVMLDDQWGKRGTFVEACDLEEATDLSTPDFMGFSIPFLKHASVSMNSDKPGLYRVIIRSISIGQEKLSELQLSRFPPDMLIAPRLGDIEPFEFYKARTLIHRGREAALMNLPQLKEMLRGDSETDKEYSPKITAA